MKRPVGPVKIKSTRVESKDKLRATLGGKIRAEVVVERRGKKFSVIAPKRLGGTQEVPADSMTDCINFWAWELGERLGSKKTKKN